MTEEEERCSKVKKSFNPYKKIMEIIKSLKPTVNLHLLPIKIHFFCLFGALGAVLPYMTIMGKELNLDSTAIGIIFMTWPFLSILAKPLFGWITDYFQNIKLVIAVLEVGLCVCFLSIIFIPRINIPGNTLSKIRIQESWISNTSFCLERNEWHGTFSVETITKFNLNTCCLGVFYEYFLSSLNKNYTGYPVCCNFKLDFAESTWKNNSANCLELHFPPEEPSGMETLNRSISSVLDIAQNSEKSVEYIFISDNGVLCLKLYNVTLENKTSKYKCEDSFNTNFSNKILQVNESNTCQKNQISVCTFASDIHSKSVCINIKHFQDFCHHLQTKHTLSSLNENIKISVYGTYQFRIFAFLVIVGRICSNVVQSLSNAACYLYLDNKPELYGQQRLWGTVSLGITCLLTGYLNDLASIRSGHKDFSPGIYLMICLTILDLIVLKKIKFEKMQKSSSIFKDVRNIFFSLEIIVYTVGVFVMGGLFALLWNYLFWFLEDLGAKQLLLGLATAVQTLVGEVFFFVISGWIVKTIGYFYCLIAAFMAFALRFILYYFLTNPWYILPIEVLHGICFSVFYSAMTSYADTHAPAGAKSTMQGVFGGAFEGIGVSIGNLLSGVGFGALGGHMTFLIAGIISLTFSILYFVFYTVLKITRSAPKIKNVL